MATCKLCESKPPEANGICEACMETCGIIEMPPAKRKAVPCLRCRGLEFIRVIPREYTVQAGLDRNYPEIAPMTLTQEPKIEDKLLGSGKTVKPPSVVLGEGMLEAYVCTGCGFIDWYVEDPSEIPIGPEFMTERIDYTGQV